MYVQDLTSSIAPQRPPAIVTHNQPRLLCTSELIPSYFAANISLSEATYAIEEYRSLSGQPLRKLYVSAYLW
jgi:hypothetical protein